MTMSADKPLSRLFRTDSYDRPVVPDATYVVRVHRNDATPEHMYETVTGEELLACAEWLDQLMSQEKTDDTNDT